jgi:hypothetical protein
MMSGRGFWFVNLKGVRSCNIEKLKRNLGATQRSTISYLA